MKCTAEEKEQRLAAQKEAQKRIEEKKVADRANRLKELQAEKEAAALKAAKSKRRPRSERGRLSTHAQHLAFSGLSCRSTKR